MGFWSDYMKENRASIAKGKAFKKEVNPVSKVHLFPSNDYLEGVTSFKSNFGFWKEWTGARYSIRENPNPHENTDLKATCVRNVYTQEWEAI